MIFDRFLVTAGLVGIIYMAASHTRSDDRSALPVLPRPIEHPLAPTNPIASCDSTREFSTEATINPAIVSRPGAQPIGKAWDRLVHPMRGPFDSLDAAFGISVSDYETMLGSPPFEELTVLDVVGAKKSALLESLHVPEVSDDSAHHALERDPMHTLHLVAKLDGKWYVEDLGATGSDHNYMHHMGPRWSKTEVDAPVLADVLGSGGAEVLVRSTRSSGYEMNAMKDVEERQLICGVGPSGVPSCASVQIGAQMNGVNTVHLHLSVACDGLATITGSLAGNLVHDQFRIAFP